MLSRGSVAYSQIAGCTKYLREGIVIAVDPSVGSSSSMPGWAVYYSGKCTNSGTLELNPTDPIHIRLRSLVYQLRKLHEAFQPDVLVYEEIPAQRYGGGGNAGAHASLLKAVGAILSTSGTDYVVGLQPVSWKPMARDTYVKGDREDAIEIGWIAIQEAKRIGEIEARPKRGRTTNRTNSKGAASATARSRRTSSARP